MQRCGRNPPGLGDPSPWGGDPGAAAGSAAAGAGCAADAEGCEQPAQLLQELFISGPRQHHPKGLGVPGQVPGVLTRAAGVKHAAGRS